jgi:hypothetical protein
VGLSPIVITGIPMVIINYNYIVGGIIVTDR